MSIFLRRLAFCLVVVPCMIVYYSIFLAFLAPIILFFAWIRDGNIRHQVEDFKDFVAFGFEGWPR